MDLDERLSRIFAPIGERVMGVLLWGSHAADEATGRSDVDVCVVAGEARDPGSVLSIVWANVNPEGLRLDVRVFEELPMYLQGAVLTRHQVLVARDEPALYEYLYPFRKRWQDQAHRQRLTHEEALRLAAGRDA